MVKTVKPRSMPFNRLPKSNMVTHKFTLRLFTAFGSPLHGDALFGQLCWLIRNQFGEVRLTELLAGYTTDKPFMVVSDALPTGHIPRPILPSNYFEPPAPTDNLKALKKQVWLPLTALSQPLARWVKLAQAESKLLPAQTFRTEHAQPHNSINRSTQTTGDGGFAPFSSTQIWYHPDARLTTYIVLDEQRISVDELSLCLTHLGDVGFGSDASTGLGKFEVIEKTAFEMPAQADANAYLTLAACAPQSQSWAVEKCFYQVKTRFGRHGDVAAISEHPFKNPILLAKAGAVFTPQQFVSRLFVGNGLGGNGEISKAIPATVHQGYAPVITIHLKPA